MWKHGTHDDPRCERRRIKRVQSRRTTEGKVCKLCGRRFYTGEMPGMKNDYCSTTCTVRAKMKAKK